MDRILELFREATPEAIGGLIAAAVGAILSAIWAAWKKTFRSDPGKLGYVIYIVVVLGAMGVSFGFTYYLLDGNISFPAENIIVLVAEFDGPDPQRYLITDYLGAHLDKELAGYADDIELRALGKPISALEGSRVARAEGEAEKAAVVVWGWYGVANTMSLHFHLETLQRLQMQYLPVLVTDIDGQALDRAVTELDDFALQNQLALEMTDLITGLALFAAHDWEESIKYWTSASTRLEDSVLILDDPSVIYFYRGSAHYYSESYEQAINDFNVAIDLNPSSALAYHGRGFAYYEMGYYEQTISDTTVAINLDPNIADAYYGRALAYANIGEYDLAVEDYEKALDELHWALAFLYGHAPNDPVAKAYYQNGLRHTSNQNFETAAVRFRRATLLNPDMAEAYFELGLVYMQLDDKQEAKLAFETCLEKSDDPDLRRRAEEQLKALRSLFR